MKVADKIKGIAGRLHLKICDATGNIISEDTAPNLIVSSGYRVLADCLTGNQPTHISHIEIGTNGNTPKLTDTQITDPIQIEIQSIENNGTNVHFHFTIGYNDAVGASIREFGLITEDGRLFSRKVRVAIDKTSYMSIVGVWEINFTDYE
ncbi:hypothetical protein LJB95_03190 [Paludibacteraceae bacterium OttesenSCG-928-F17]|nr:hypothetical protein [Paludibacteraceae bacterium OttesenSCG-928-F17]